MTSILIYLFLSIVAAGNLNKVNIVSPEGLVSTIDQVKNHMLSAGHETIYTTSIIKTFDSNFHLFNEAFGSSVEDGEVLNLSMKNGHALLCPSFENLNSNNYFGTKVLDLCSFCSNNICLLVSGHEFPSDKTCFEQCYRRIIKSVSSRTTSISSISFVVDISNNPELKSTENQELFTNRLKTVLDSTTEDIQESDNVVPTQNLSILYADFTVLESLFIAADSIYRTSLEAPTPLSIDEVVASIFLRWNILANEMPKPLYTYEEKQSLFRIESAFTLGLSQIQFSASEWQKRVSVSGKIVGKFAERVRALLKSVTTAYKQRTAGTITLRERNRRAVELKENLKQIATSLFNQQFAILQTKTNQKLRASLLNLPELTKEAESQVLRNVLFDFKVALGDLEVDELGLKLTPSLISEISTKLQAVAAELPETPAAKLLEIKKIENLAKSQKKKKGARSVSVALNLVGMLRPPGYGNLQGFVNYATSLAGLPLELLMGFQNDGDSPEIMGEDREYPLLRLQPKIHFDIDA